MSSVMALDQNVTDVQRLALTVFTRLMTEISA